MRNAFSTIISSNYLPQALTLHKSFSKIYPGSRLFILIIDIEKPVIEQESDISFLVPEDLHIDPVFLVNMRNFYDLVELATSLKPFLLKFLLSEGFDTATYLDPDIQIFGKLDEGIAASLKFGVALTPHRLTPQTPSIQDPGDLEFLRYGVFNLGYITVSRLGDQFLEWWASRLIYFSTRYPRSAVFTDQKWIDLTPAYFAYGKISNPGYNVAPWNLSERNLLKSKNQYFVDTSPLVFFHFSQISGSLSRGGLPKIWEARLSRIDQSNHSRAALNSILKEYTQDLKEFNSERIIGAKFVLLSDPFSLNSYFVRKNRIASILNNPNLSRYRMMYRRFSSVLNNYGSKKGFLRYATKFDTINGLREGFSSDLKRFQNRFRV